MAAARTALREKTQRRITAAQSHTATLLAQLRALSPDAVLQRGFAVVTSSTGEIIKSAAEVTVADSLDITLHHGSLRAVVQSTEVEETS
jgi:exodeoxyribonuclease VII large subunit